MASLPWRSHSTFTLEHHIKLMNVIVKKRICLLGVLVATTALAVAEQKPVPTVRFDRVQGIVSEVDPAAKSVELKLIDGSVQKIRVSDNAYLHALRGHDERSRMLDPKGIDGFRPGVRVEASGLVYSDSPELVAKEVTFFSPTADVPPVFEDSDWWSSQARELAEFWIRTQFGEGEIGDASSYRTDITKTGTKRSETINLQET